MASFTLPESYVDVAQRPALAHAHAVERAEDRERQLVLVQGGVGEVLHGQLLEPVGRQRRRHPALVALPRWASGRCSRTPSMS